MRKRIVKLWTRVHSFKPVNALLNASIVLIILALGVANAAPVLAAPVATTLVMTSVSPSSVQSGSTGLVQLQAKLTRNDSGAGVVGATVRFFVSPSTSSVGSGFTGAGGIATLLTYNPSALLVGPHAVTASFVGNSTYSASTSTNSITLDVQPALTNLVMTSVTPNSVWSGWTGAVALKATLTRSDNNAGIVGAAVKFVVDGNELGTAANTNSVGVATLSYNPSTLPLGIHTVTASFAGQTISNKTYSASTSSNSLPLTITVRTTLILTVTPNRVGVGYAGPVTLAAKLTRTTGGSVIPGANIAFQVDGVQVDGIKVTDVNGVATLIYNPSGLALGNRAVKATFAGGTIDSTTYAGSLNSKTLSVIDWIPTTVELMVADTNIVPLWGSFDVVAKVKRNDTLAYITGVPVTLTVAGPAPATDIRFTGTTNTIASYGAVFTVPMAEIPPGDYTITAVFSGTEIYLPSQGSSGTLLLRRMATFEIDQAKLDFKNKPDDDKVRVQGRLELALGDRNGVSLSDDVIVTVGPLSETIQMAQRGENEERWEYQRPEGGTGDIKHMTINWKNGEFDIRMDKVDLAAVTNPVPVSIQIGYEFGGQSIRMREKGNHWDYHQPLLNALIAGADRQLSLQGTYFNSAGDGYGPPDVSYIDNTWEWKIGSGNTAWNVVGPSATGLLAAYERTGDAAYLNGALLTGGTLVEKYNTLTSDGAQWEDRPFSQDIEFLVRLSADSGDPSYAAVAGDWYNIVITNKTATETADRYLYTATGLNRKSLAGWDLASQIRAAIAVGQVDYARGIASRLIERRDDWEHIPLGSWDYTNDSYASLLWALRILADDTFNSYASEIREALLAAQSPDGSWGGSYQSTAYAILGLVQPRTPVSSQVTQVIDNAWTFLRDAQSPAGGWSYPPEYGEVNSEVLMALGVLRGDGGGTKLVHIDSSSGIRSPNTDQGNKLGLTDPNPAKGNDTGKHKFDPAP